MLIPFVVTSVDRSSVQLYIKSAVFRLRGVKLNDSLQTSKGTFYFNAQVFDGKTDLATVIYRNIGLSLYNGAPYYAYQQHNHLLIIYPVPRFAKNIHQRPTLLYLSSKSLLYPYFFLVATCRVMLTLSAMVLLPPTLKSRRLILKLASNKYPFSVAVAVKGKPTSFVTFRMVSLPIRKKAPGCPVVVSRLLAKLMRGYCFTSK